MRTEGRDTALWVWASWWKLGELGGVGQKQMEETGKKAVNLFVLFPYLNFKFPVLFTFTEEVNSLQMSEYFYQMTCHICETLMFMIAAVGYSEPTKF